MESSRQSAAAHHHFGFTQPPRDSRWPSLAVACALTLAIFIVAFTSMRRAPDWLSPTTADRPIQVSVRLESPPPAPLPHPAPTRRAPITPPRVVAPVAPNTPLPATQPVAPVAVPQPPVAPPRDTGIVGTKPSGEPAPPVASPATRLGAPVAPAGVSRIIAAPEVQAQRNAAAEAGRAAALAAQWNSITSDAVRQMVGAGQSVAVGTARRTTSAGNGADVHVMAGDGVNGVGAVGGSSLSSGSIGLPLFSRGPSAAQRRKNDSIDADNRAILGRLQLLIKHRRDSVVADSLRRDSLAKIRKP